MKVEDVKVLSVDEVARRRGHEYLTVVSDPADGKSRRSRVLYVTEGKDAAALGGNRGQIAEPDHQRGAGGLACESEAGHAVDGSDGDRSDLSASFHQPTRNPSHSPTQTHIEAEKRLFAVVNGSEHFVKVLIINISLPYPDL